MSNDTTLPGLDLEVPSFSTCHDINERCPVEATMYGDYFTISACAFFTAAYTLLLISQIYFGWRSKTWSFTCWLLIGSIFELMGYASRIVMSHNPWTFGAFAIQLILLMVAPTFVSASISITFKHLVLWYGPEWSFVKPSLYPWIFVGTDFFSIALQAFGGVISSIATGGDSLNMGLLDAGRSLLLAGTIFQVVNMVFCGGLMVIYVIRRRKALHNGSQRLQSSEGDSFGLQSVAGHTVEGEKRPVDTHTRNQRHKTKMFIWAITFAYIAILIRCIYRIPEIVSGFGSELMQNETLFLILDGTMILLAVATICIFHPASFFPFLGPGKEHGGTAKAATHEDAYEMQSSPDSLLR